MSRTALVWLRSLRATPAVLMRVVRPGRMVGHLPVVRRSPPAVYPYVRACHRGPCLGGWCTEVRGLRIPMAPANDRPRRGGPVKAAVHHSAMSPASRDRSITAR